MSRAKYAKTGKHIAIYVALIIVAILTLFPLLWAIGSSLRTDQEIFKYATPFTYRTIIPEQVTFQSYVEIFRDFNLLQPIVNTLIVAVIAIIAGNLVNSIAAFAFATFDFRFKNILLGIILASFMVPFESIAIPLYKVVNNFGWVDTFAGIIVPGIADGLVLFLFMQFFKDLPTSLIEAARVDGATWKMIFAKIIIPLSAPIFITAGLMIFMTHWNSYLWPLIVARSPEIRLIQVALSDFQQEKVTLWSNLYAASIVSAVVPLMLFLPLQKYYVEGITSGGVKG